MDGVDRMDKHRSPERLRRWELALLLAVAAAALLGARLGKEQDALAEKVIRLHVVANSDSRQDQSLKLKVRDAVLQEGGLRLAGLDREQAMAALTEALPELGKVAAATVAAEGYDYPVRVTLGPDRFPTKEYEDFALPAGEYTALRVELGEGQGRNWWCVVFPPLCMGAVSEPCGDAMEALSPDQMALLTGENEGYVVKFKLLEWWGKLQEG